MASTALRWLRRNYPVDEEAAYEARVQSEKHDHEEKLVADAERLGIYKPQQGVRGGNVYGKGVLDEFREHREREIEKKRKEQAEEVKANTGSLEESGRKGAVAHREEPEWIRHYRKHGLITDATTPPEMSMARRISPSICVAAITILCCFIASSAYFPPSHSARIWPETPPAAATILGLILANSIILLAWRVPPLYRTLNKYFVNVPGYPFAFSTLGNLFSHQSVLHFAMNMTVLWIVGTKLHDSLNRADFLNVYFTGGVVGSIVSLVGHALRRNLVTSSLGASGSICGVLGAYLWINSNQYFRPIFLPSPSSDASHSARSYAIPASLILAIFLSFEVFSVIRRRGTTDHLAHLGGYAGGIAAVSGLKYTKGNRSGKSEPGSRRRFVGDEQLNRKGGDRGGF
ncbi:MAG: hypothetical protein M1837_004952 [Sclerophora amabilis]|nr:MAG: hypothetical protein M1837_004952 [Sclerophora amabilis]